MKYFGVAVIALVLFGLFGNTAGAGDELTLLRLDASGDLSRIDIESSNSLSVAVEYRVILVPDSLSLPVWLELLGAATDPRVVAKPITHNGKQDGLPGVEYVWSLPAGQFFKFPIRVLPGLFRAIYLVVRLDFGGSSTAQPNLVRVQGWQPGVSAQGDAVLSRDPFIIDALAGRIPFNRLRICRPALEGLFLCA